MKSKNYISLIGYGITHGLIDLSCAAVFFGGAYALQLEANVVFTLALAYGLLAFGLQAPLGFVVDYFHTPKESALLGTLFVSVSLFLLHAPTYAVIFAGIGNALFHVGGGSISLNYNVQRATYPGIFVAPGALGLTLGILIGKGGHFLLWPILSALIIAGSFIAGSNIPKINYKRKSVKREVRYYEIIIFLLLLSVAIRALYGLTAVFEWKVNTYLLLTLTLAIVGGKALGGYVADTFGWMKTAIFALVISAPLLSFFQSSPFLAISGAFLFQFTMPITLTALSALLPGRSATAFGLAATTLIIGALPAFFGAKEIFHNQIITFITVLISAGALLISFAYVYTFLKLQNINV